MTNFFQKTVIDKLNKPIAHYTTSFPSYNQMLSHLQQQGYFKNQQQLAEDYQWKDFLQESNLTISSDLAPLDLLKRQVKEQDLGDPFSQLSKIPKIPDLERLLLCYIDLIGDVLENELAKRFYEKPCDREGLFESEHALQAGKIMAELSGYNLSDTIAEQLHDIARCTQEDAEYGHKNHGVEGSVILQALGLNLDFAKYHPFAKTLLLQFCPEYPQLVSNVSLHSHQFQSSNIAEQIVALEKLPSKQLAFVLYKIMLMRLIDDMSKFPRVELIQKLGGEPSYIAWPLFRNMLLHQTQQHLARVPNLADYVQQVKSGITLLLRAEKYTHQPEIYAKYQEILQPLRPEKENNASQAINQLGLMF